MRARAGALVAAVSITAACASDSVDPAFSVVDSAGVSIVTYAEVEPPQWTVGEEPVLTLGTVDGEGPDAFFRISSALKLESGELAVFNSGSGELRFFDAEGAHLRTVGRRGEGPGEYGGAVRLRRLAGDTVAAWDTRARRLTIVAPDGTVVRTVSPDGIERRPELITVLPDGATFFEQEIPVFEPAPTELTRRYSNYIVWNADGSVRDSLPRQVNVDIIRMGDGPLAGPPIFGAVTVFAGDASGYWVGLQYEPELVRYSMSGQELVRTRWPDGDRAVQPSDFDAYLEGQLEGVDDPELRQARIDLWEGTMMSSSFPPYSDLFVDRLGVLWVRDYERPGGVDTPRWLLFDREGVIVGRVQSPMETGRVFDIGEDYIVTETRDDFGVEYIVVLSFDRPQ